MDTLYMSMGNGTHAFSTPILMRVTVCAADAAKWALSNKSTKTFAILSDLYWQYSTEAGVNPVVAYCHAAKESNFGAFGNKLREEFYNPCGLSGKTCSGRSNGNYARFTSWRQGISAHVDHLALYAGANGYPKQQTYDPQHSPQLFGTAKSVEEFSRIWSDSRTYTMEIINMMSLLSNASSVKSHL